MNRQFTKHPITSATSANTSTNNVKRVCNYFQVGRPLFVDKMKNGYRIKISSLVKGVEDETQAQQVVDEISENLGIDCTCRKRGGYGNPGTWDLIIPFAADDETVEYNYSRY